MRNLSADIVDATRAEVGYQLSHNKSMPPFASNEKPQSQRKQHSSQQSGKRSAKSSRQMGHSRKSSDSSRRLPNKLAKIRKRIAEHEKLIEEQQSMIARSLALTDFTNPYPCLPRRSLSTKPPTGARKNDKPGLSNCGSQSTAAFVHPTESDGQLITDAYGEQFGLPGAINPVETGKFENLALVEPAMDQYDLPFRKRSTSSPPVQATTEIKLFQVDSHEHLEPSQRANAQLDD